MKGKLIVIEGVDSSGKETHTKMLFQRLLDDNLNIKKVEFPDYNSQSSALVKMYLNGDFGSNPEDVNPYAASTFFAIDRYASFKTSWQDFYNNGGIVLADRYTMSNMIHQASKVKDKEKKLAFLDWLWDLEFVKLGIPVPDCIIFLDMPPEYGRLFMKERKNKITGLSEKDIHEKSPEHLTESYNNACEIADLYKWNHVCCVRDGVLRSIADINDEVYSIVKKSVL
jgi:dTMP kinase